MFFLCRLELWDTNGQERYRSLAPLYYRGAQAAVVVFDVTERQTFDDANSWVKELRHFAGADMVIALVGNKVDLVSRRQVDPVEASEYALSQGTFARIARASMSLRPSNPSTGLFYTETSAKTAMNVEQVFAEIVRRLPLSSALKSKGGDVDATAVAAPKQKPGCC